MMGLGLLTCYRYCAGHLHPTIYTGSLHGWLVGLRMLHACALPHRPRLPIVKSSAPPHIPSGWCIMHGVALDASPPVRTTSLCCARTHACRAVGTRMSAAAAAVCGGAHRRGSAAAGAPPPHSLPPSKGLMWRAPSIYSQFWRLAMSSPTYAATRTTTSIPVRIARFTPTERSLSISFAAARSSPSSASPVGPRRVSPFISFRNIAEFAYLHSAPTPRGGRREALPQAHAGAGHDTGPHGEESRAYTRCPHERSAHSSLLVIPTC